MAPKPAMPSVFVGISPAMRALLSVADEIAGSDATVLIHGETGSGKEVIAREFHLRSSRRSAPFVKINCAALPSELIESELFGYERGAFTGAAQRKPGLFEVADQGTILLDEIGDMDIRLQAKLLQVLQDQEFYRVGGKDLIRVNVRVIAATHRDLETAIDSGAFRQDLFYRLDVISLRIPALRERREDIIPMAEFLLALHAKGTEVPPISAELAKSLLEYHWPGNVRELENMMRKLVVLADPKIIISEIQAKLARTTPGLVSPAPMPIRSDSVEVGDDSEFSILTRITSAKEQNEREVIVATLDAVRWNRKRAAAMLEINYKALLYKMKKLRIVDLDAPVASKRLDPRTMPDVSD